MKLQKIQLDNEAWPDLFISESRGGFYGLYLELKKDRNEVFNKNGSMSKANQIVKQSKTLQKLREKGYMAVFSWGINYSLDVIANYLDGKYQR